MPGDDPGIDPESLQRDGLFSRLTRLFSQEEAEEAALPVANGEGAQAATSSEMRLRVAEFQQARVRDVMIPRIEIAAVDVEATLGELLAFFADNAHSRVPIYRGTLDDPLGFVHLKDVVTEIARDGSAENLATRPLLNLKREILYVPSSVRLPDLMVKMQTSRIHIALVVDEYGGTDGLVSLEDLVEQIVGDIEDEHDEDTAYIVSKGVNLWEVDARALIEDFEEEAGQEVTLQDYEDEVDTLGGLVFALAGRVPQRGEIIQHPAGVGFEILDADLRRIKRIRIRCGTTRMPATKAGDAPVIGDVSTTAERPASGEI